SRVRPGVLLTRASLRRRSSALIMEDFPTLERPRKATSATSGGGAPASSAAEVTNSEPTIFTRPFLDPGAGRFGAQARDQVFVDSLEGSVVFVRGASE